MDNKKNKLYLNLVQILFAAAILWYLFSKIDLPVFFTAARNLNLLYVVIALSLNCVGVFLSAFKWFILLSAKGVRISYARATKLYFIGGFFNCFLPTTVGGDVIKILHLRNNSDHFEDAVSATFMDRLSGIVALATILIFASILHIRFLLQNKIVLVLIAVLSVLIGFACSILFNRTIAEKMRFLYAPFLKLLALFNAQEYPIRLYDSVHRFNAQKNILMLTLGISLLFHLVAIAAFYCMNLAVAMGTHINYFFIFMPLILCLTMIPNSLHGIGLQEGLAYFFFIRVDANVEHIIMFSFLIHIIIFMVYSFGGIIYIFDRIKNVQYTK